MANLSKSTFFRRPSTRLGWWAAGLLFVYGVGFLFNSAVLMRLGEVDPWLRTLLIIYAISMLLCGLAAGILGVIAVIRQHERCGWVWLAILTGAFVLSALLGEFLIPH
jgi:hypothetical protein